MYNIYIDTTLCFGLLEAKSKEGSTGIATGWALLSHDEFHPHAGGTHFVVPASEAQCGNTEMSRGNSAHNPQKDWDAAHASWWRSCGWRGGGWGYWGLISGCGVIMATWHELQWYAANSPVPSLSGTFGNLKRLHYVVFGGNQLPCRLILSRCLEVVKHA